MQRSSVSTSLPMMHPLPSLSAFMHNIPMYNECRWATYSGRMVKTLFPDLTPSPLILHLSIKADSRLLLFELVRLVNYYTKLHLSIKADSRLLLYLSPTG